MNINLSLRSFEVEFLPVKNFCNDVEFSGYYEGCFRQLKIGLNSSMVFQFTRFGIRA